MTVIYLVIFFLLLSLAYAGFLFAPWVPTRKKDQERIIALLDPQEGDTIYELGSGTGHVAIALAEKYAGIEVRGIELVLPLYLFSLVKAYLQKSRVHFFWKNFFNVDLSDANAIYLFGTPKPLAKKLKEKIERECKPGTKIVSYVFAFPDWTPIEVSKPTKEDLSIYVYKMEPPDEPAG